MFHDDIIGDNDIELNGRGGGSVIIGDIITNNVIMKHVCFLSMLFLDIALGPNLSMALSLAQFEGLTQTDIYSTDIFIMVV